MAVAMAGSVVFGQGGYTVDMIQPQIGRRGTTVEVIVRGTRLDDPQDVLFYQDGIRCTGFTPLEECVNDRGIRQRLKPGEALRMTLKIAPDCPLGEHLLRLRTRDFLSEMVAFWVTPLTIVDEKCAWADRNDTAARNDAPEFAQAIPLNVAVSGICPGGVSQDHDWYAIDAAKGERITVEVLASRLGTHHYDGLNDPAVSIRDAQGRLIARNDDNALHTQDPVVQFIPEADGRFFIHVRQQMDYESTVRPYVMHVGTFPRPMVASPLGASAGRAAEITLLGDIAGPITRRVEVPEPGPFETAYVELFSADENGHTSFWPNRIHASRLTDIFERETNGEPTVITRSLPVALNGVITAEGETDWYRFNARKGERYRIRTYAKTLDSELDARIVIKPADGNPSAQRWDEDDSTWDRHDLVGHHYRHQIKDRLDPIFLFEPQADGDWLMGISDTRRESGPRHVYRVEFQPHVDGAFVTLADYPSQAHITRDRIVLFPGHAFTRSMIVQKGLGSTFAGPLQVRAEGLPTGVVMEAPTFRQADGSIPVTFVADAAAKPTTALINIVVEPVDPTIREAFRGGFVLNTRPTDRRGGFAMCFRLTRRLALAVVEQPAFDLSVDPPQTPLVRNGTLDMTVRVERHPGFEGAVYLESDWLPPGVGKQPPLIIEAERAQATYRLTAGKEARVGDFPFTITGRENEGGDVRTAAGFHYVSSRPVSVTVGEPHVVVILARSAIERGSDGTITAEINHQKPFSGEAELRLGRLPYGVEQIAPFPRITGRDTTATFHLRVTNDCLVGSYRDIFCEALVPDNGQMIREESGSGVLRVDPERN